VDAAPGHQPGVTSREARLRVLSSSRYFHDRGRWAEAVDMLDRERMPRRALLHTLVRRAEDYDALMLNGSVGTSELYVDLVAAGLAARRRHPPAIVLYDCSWKLGTVLDRIACHVGIRLIDSPAITYCVLSSEEREIFPRTWSVDADRVVFTPFSHTLSDEDLDAGITHDGPVFAGGNSLRDYGPLVEAARGLDARVVIASKLLSQEALQAAPPNVEAGPVPHERFVELMRTASVVVTPIERGSVRSAGMQTWLNAMALGKLAIVTDSFGARDYIEHRRTGLIVAPGDAQALHEALRWALDPAHATEVDEIRRRGADLARTRFSPEAYAESLLAVAEQRVAERRAPTAA
jgi:glycosyltransferase involved in cell wall biosynthesis